MFYLNLYLCSVAILFVVFIFLTVKNSKSLTVEDLGWSLFVGILWPFLLIVLAISFLEDIHISKIVIWKKKEPK